MDLNNLINRIDDRRIKFDPFEMWMEIMDLVLSNLFPHFKDRDACDKLVTSLVSLGTNHLLDEDRNHVLIAELAQQTVIYIETMSR